MSGNIAGRSNFTPQRLYADVVTLNFEDGSRWDNGVLQLINLSFSGQEIDDDFSLELQARLNHTKVSVERHDSCSDRCRAIQSGSKSEPVNFCLSASADAHQR